MRTSCCIATSNLFPLLLGLCWGCLACHSPSQNDNTPPNIILIMADDMGYSDLGCTGSEIQTPHLDALAKEGVLFTHFYNTSRCCPTRASLMTGLYQHQAGLGHMDADLGSPSYQGRMNQHCITMAQALQQVNYRNIMLGKWHLGHEPEHWPLGRGFDRMYGIPKGGGVYFYPCVGRDRQVYLNDQQVIPDSSWYSTDAFTDYAIQFAREAAEDQQPFFLYLAYIAPHFPLQAWPEDVEPYKNTYQKGYEAIRNLRFQKQQELGIVSNELSLSPLDGEDWSKVDQEQEALKMSIYAAQVDRMDKNIGRLVSALKTQNIYENTVIIFLSDNGAASVNLNDTPDARLGSRDSWAAYGKSWANVSNTPYRLYKSMVHEGGIISPLIMHWPAGLNKKGLITHEPAHVNDLMPTILQLAGTSYPNTYQGKTLIPIQGHSILPLAQGERQQANKQIFWEHQGNKAVRKGPWKLVKRHRRDWELYNLQQDPTELHNLRTQQTDKTKELLSALQDWEKESGVLDWPVKNN